jgi:hypothetical protein
MTDVQATLLGALLGGIIGVVGTYLGAIRIANRQFLIDAATKLREAFRDELATVQAPGEVVALNLLEDAFKKHLIAISEFNRRLPKCKRRAFNQAWQDYHCYPQPPFIHFLEQYTTRTGSIEQKKKNRSLAIERIEHILSFTN